MDTQIRERTEQRLAAAKRLERILSARDDLGAFMHIMLPDEEYPEDAGKSEYQDAPHARLLRDILVQIESGERKRVAVSIPPQHGKTWHLSIYGPAWILGRNPKAKIIVATYNETRAEELGADFRRVLLSETYKAIFPDVVLSKGSQAVSKMGTEAGGKIFFVSLHGPVTGRKADYFIIDDPMKDDEEVQSDQFRENMWKRFYSVAYSRGSKNTRILVVHTRWHADDLIGRLCDKSHPERDKRFSGVAEDWDYLNIPGVVEDPHLAKALGLSLSVPTDEKVIRAFGAKPMVALWEADKDLPFFAQWKNGEPRTFSALAMGQPTVEDGEFFHAQDLDESGYHDIRDLPDNLRFYGASDHAVSEKQYRDYTVAGCVGVDENDDIWVLPDLTWDRIQTDKTVEELLYHFKEHRPDLWWMESELISKSFGPFLHKRMTEERIYVTIDKITPSKDKQTRARAIQGRISMRKVRFPLFAPWWSRARSQLLQFPYGANDDFVDFISLIGLGLMKEFRPGTADAPQMGVVEETGSIKWIMQDSLRRAREQKRRASVRGW